MARRIVSGVLALSFVLFFNRGTFADDADTVHVKYAQGDAELDTMQNAAQYFTNRDLAFDAFPDELGGLIFTRHGYGPPADVTITAAPGTTVYLLLGTKPGADPCRAAAESVGWGKIGDVHLKGRRQDVVLAYKRIVEDDKPVTLPCGSGFDGITVAAKAIALDSGTGTTEKEIRRSGSRVKAARSSSTRYHRYLRSHRPACGNAGNNQGT